MQGKKVPAPNFGRAAEDYRRYRLGFPDSIMDRLQTAGIGCAGQKVLDLGTGTGSLARLFAQRGCAVIGLDRALELLNQAKQLDSEASVRVDYMVGLAESTSLVGESIDVVAAGQCWHWFDRAAAATEARRLLVPNGRLVIAHFDWIPLDGNVAAETERLILEFNRAWPLGGGTGIYPQWLRDVGEAGFGEIETFSYDVLAEYHLEAWVGRVRASAGIVALEPVARERFSSRLTELLEARFPEGPLQVPHRVWVVLAKKLPPRAP